MAKFEAGTDPAVDGSEKIAQQRQVALETGWKLKKRGTQASAERRAYVGEVRHRVCDPAQARDVRDALRGLERETEMLGRLGAWRAGGEGTNAWA